MTPKGAVPDPRRTARLIGGGFGAGGDDGSGLTLFPSPPLPRAESRRRRPLFPTSLPRSHVEELEQRLRRPVAGRARVRVHRPVVLAVGGGDRVRSGNRPSPGGVGPDIPRGLPTVRFVRGTSRRRVEDAGTAPGDRRVRSGVGARWIRDRRTFPVYRGVRPAPAVGFVRGITGVGRKAPRR